jgi:DNA-binding transcriptional LysR family regulator
VTLNQLRVFRTVALTRNLSTAARALFLTVPSVSMQLRALERDLGVTLYERRRGQVVLTEAGQTLLQYAEAILSAEEEAVKEIAALRGTLRGRLRIGTNLTGGMYVLPGVLRRYRRRYPEAEVSLAIDSSARVVDSVLQGLLDVGLAGGPLDPARFDSRTLGRDELVLIASPENPLAGGGAIAVEDLGAQALILPGVGSRSRWLLESALHQAGLAVRVALSMNGTEEVKKAVEANLGIGFVSAYSVIHETERGDLVVLPLRGFRLMRDVELFWPKGKALPELAEPLVELAEQELEELAPAFRRVTGGDG